MQCIRCKIISRFVCSIWFFEMPTGEFLCRLLNITNLVKRRPIKTKRTGKPLTGINQFRLFSIST